MKRRIIPFFTLLFLLPSALGAQVITSNETVTVTALVGAVPPPSGGGGGAFSVPEHPTVGFSGYAYPNARVVLLKNISVQAVTKADEKGFFSISVEELYERNVLYGLYAEDTEKERSILLNYPLAVTQGVFTQVSGIVFAPTITTDKVQVKRGDVVTTYGQARPEKDLLVVLSGQGGGKNYIIQSFKNGKYSLAISTEGLTDGEYTLTVRYQGDKRASKVVKFTVGERTIMRSQDIVTLPGDCNKDTLIDLRDFSVLAFWYLRSNPPECVDTNDDNLVDIVDFSVLAYYWTG